MAQKKENALTGLVLLSGIVIGVAGALLYSENRPMNASKVLKLVKNEFNPLGKVVGSWIDYDSIEYHTFESRPLVYIGGISIEIDDHVTNYQFAADVYTGELIDYFPQF